MPTAPGEPWIDTGYERAERLAEGAAPDILDPYGLATTGGPSEATHGDPRIRWLERLSAAFPPGRGREPALDWAGVSRRLREPNVGEYRVETSPTEVRALGRLALGVADGWAPELVVDLRTGEARRVSVVCRADRVVQW